MSLKIFKTPNFLWDFYSSEHELNESIDILNNTIIKIDNDWKDIISKIDNFHQRLPSLYENLESPSYLTVSSLDKSTFIETQTKRVFKFKNLVSRFGEDISYNIEYPDGTIKKYQVEFTADATNVDAGNILKFKVIAQTETEMSSIKTINVVVIDEPVLSCFSNINETTDTNFKKMEIDITTNKSNVISFLNTSDVENKLNIEKKPGIGWFITKDISDTDIYKIYVCIEDKYQDKSEFYYEF